MKKILIVFFTILSLFCKGQSLQSLDTVKAPAGYENIFIRHLYSDSLVSSFVIFIKNEVKVHRHVYHTEHIYILDGEGEMKIGDKKIRIQKGNIIFVPKNTIHSLKVISQTPIKALSVQTPFFDGKDRVFVE